MGTILILYSTNDGHTLEICKRLQHVLVQQTQKVTLLSIDENNSTDLELYDKIVIGACIRYGKHSIKIHNYINDNLHILKSKPNAFFSVNLVARKQEKSEPLTNPYLKKFLSQISWEPKEVAVFAGKVDYPRYRVWDRLMIQFIMWVTKGPTDPTATIEFTNWKQVENFGKRIGSM